MKVKALGLIVISVVAAAAVIVCGTTIYPSLKIKEFEGEYLRGSYEVYGRGEYFKDYETELESGNMVENDYFSVRIPDRISFSEEKSTDECSVYANSEAKKWVEVTNTVAETYVRLEEIDLNAHFDVNLRKPSDLKEGYEKLCGSYPDSAFAEEKCMVLLDLDSFDHWDYNKAYAFCQLATFKGANCWDVDAYVYESDGISGILYVQDVKFSETKQDAYSATFRFYSNSDLNHPYTIKVLSDSLDEIYGVINSITMK